MASARPEGLLLPGPRARSPGPASLPPRPQDDAGAVLPQPAGGAALRRRHPPGRRARRLRLPRGRPAPRQRQPRGPVREGERPPPRRPAPAPPSSAAAVPQRGAAGALRPAPQLQAAFPLRGRGCPAQEGGGAAEVSSSPPAESVNPGPHPGPSPALGRRGGVTSPALGASRPEASSRNPRLLSRAHLGPGPPEPSSRFSQHTPPRSGGPQASLPSGALWSPELRKGLH